MAEYPTVIYDGKLTEAGQDVITYMESVIDGVGNNVDELNRLPGHIKHYYVQTRSLKQPPERFAEEFRNSSMKYAWADMQYLQESEQQKIVVEETADKTSKLEESLAELRESLLAQIEDLKKQNSSLKGQLTRVKNQLKESDEEEATPDDDPEEDEAEESTDVDTEAEEDEAEE